MAVLRCCQVAFLTVSFPVHDSKIAVPPHISKAHPRVCDSCFLSVQIVLLRGVYGIFFRHQAFVISCPGILHPGIAGFGVATDLILIWLEQEYI